MDAETLNINAWQLSHLAQALTRAKRLEALREAFHEELYDCIAYSTTNFDPLNPKGIITSTEGQAIKIIQAKERYDRQILHEYDRHIRWGNFLKLASESDKQIMVRYFKKKKYVRPEVIKSLLFRLRKKLDSEETLLEKERTAKAAREHQEYLKNAKPKPAKRKLSIFEEGKWILIDPEEYERQQWRKRFDADREEMQKYFKEAFQHQDAL